MKQLVQAPHFPDKKTGSQEREVRMGAFCTRVRSPFEMHASHIGTSLVEAWLLHSQADFWKQPVMTEGFGSLPPVWKSQIELWAQALTWPGPGPMGSESAGDGLHPT